MSSPLTRQELSIVYQMREEGFSAIEIAAWIGCWPGTLGFHLGKQTREQRAMAQYRWRRLWGNIPRPKGNLGRLPPLLTADPLDKTWRS